MVSLARRGSPYEEEGLDPRLALSVPEQLYRLLEELRLHLVHAQHQGHRGAQTAEHEGEEAAVGDGAQDLGGQRQKWWVGVEDGC